ncbi:MAG: TVP38/TMEM64 family protein, partial [Clostridia bacterium]|nr:TVP38/TMEM64 family protein [Clostridia bacterium]
MKREWTEKHRKALMAGGLLAFVVLMLVVVLCIGKPLLQLAGEPEAFRGWINARGWYGWILFVLMMAVQVFVAVIPGEALEIAAGYAFGAVEGTI